MAFVSGSTLAKVSTYFRNKRDRTIKDLIQSIHAEKGSVNVIDLGGSSDYWRRFGMDFLAAHGCRITLVNLTSSELGSSPDTSGIITHEVGDATNLPQYRDDAFDLVHSNSVVEHLGNWDTMKRFAAESRRLAPAYYVQTPNFWFPIDPHYYTFPIFHWLPRPLRARLFTRWKIAQGGRADSWDKAFSMVDASRLLDRQQMKTLYPDGAFSAERFFGLAKSLIMIRKRR